ncbi:VWA domain-containing protein [Thalassotalea atypica]|uniref:VWA domain-containing protein n=1 Tax=Thalassotalea atypica TaxID=2054316 RepID=UPI002572C766|nr:VWA domain-containing protein [Thalassotalea atypica]
MNFNDFHFIRPVWLLAIIALMLAMYLLRKIRVSQSGWTKLVPKHLSSVLLEQGNEGKSLSLALPFLTGLLAIVALAGPTWQKLPQPVYQIQRGSVLIMDMSYSMYATDITPNRLTRARYKAIDLLDNLNEGDIGLIAYAGDAFVISPLTEDINNIKLLLPSLSPDLMPEMGSNPLAALYLANDMLANAGHVEGDIYWFTDGIDFEDISDINDWSKSFPHRLNILGVGTNDGAPIKLTNGELLKDDKGAIVLPRLSSKYLAGVANQSTGHYQTISHENDDIEALTKPSKNQQEKQQGENNNTGDQWQEAGPYLVILLLPLLLGYFRRGVLSVAAILMFTLPSKPSYAVDFSNLWKTKDQQGQQQYNQESYDTAAALFEDPMWKGSAQYKNGEYEQALSSFQQLDTADAYYNQGNAYAQLKDFDNAIEAYDKALEKNPNDENAQKNKALIEELKKQQEQQQQQENEQQQGDQSQDQQDSEEQQSEQKEQQNKDSQQSDSSDENQSQSEQKKDDQANSQENQSEQEQQDQQQENSNAQQNEAEKDLEQEKEQQAQNEAQPEEGEPETKEAQAQQARQEQIDQEKAQKHQQLLNKVTDDPYLLLRNKMQLEYQKRRQNGSQSGVKKKW